MAMTQEELERRRRSLAQQPSTMMPTTNAARIAGGQAGGGAFSLEDARRAIDRASRAGLRTYDAPRTFTLGELHRAAQQVSQVGGEIPVRQAQFDNPAAVAAYIGQMREALDPLVRARTELAGEGYNRAMQQLRNQLAATGSLVGGGAVSQQLDAARGFGRELAAIEAEAQAQAIPLGLQAAQLGLSEDQLRFAQMEANRQFLFNRAQQFYENLARGMSLEEAQRQFRAGLEADLAQRHVQNLLAGLGLQDEMRRFDLSHQLALDQFREGQRQFNIGAAMDLTRMFGTPIAPAMSGDVLFGRVAGMMPIATRQAIADLTGVDPVTGQPTFAARQAAAVRASAGGLAGGLAGGADRGSILAQAAQLGSHRDAYMFLRQQGWTDIEAQRDAQNLFSEGADPEETAAAIGAVYDYLANVNWERANIAEMRRFLEDQARRALQAGEISRGAYTAVLREINRVVQSRLSQLQMRQGELPEEDWSP